jgi:hypothetical protein
MSAVGFRVLLVPTTVWIAELIISDRTAEKIASKHRLSPRDVRDAILCRHALIGRWSADRQGNPRVLVRVTVGDRPCLVVIYPAGDDVWHLASAYVLTDQAGA